MGIKELIKGFYGDIETEKVAKQLSQYLNGIKAYGKTKTLTL